MFVLFGCGTAAGQTAIADKLKAAGEETRQTLEALDAAITKAQGALQQLKEMDPEAREAALDESFQSFRQQIVVVLERVDDNGEFMDAMAAAEVQTRRLKAWFERQPADYPRRDETIARLDKALQRFVTLKDEIRGERDTALGLLADIGTRHAQAVQLAKADLVDQALDTVQDVVDSIKGLNGKLRTVVDQAIGVVPDAAVPVQ